MKHPLLTISGKTHYFLFALFLAIAVALGGEIVDRVSLPEVQHVKADTCGDGTVEPSEQCDDNNTSNGDGCSASCQIDVTGFNSSLALTIDNTKVDETLSNFPVLLKDSNFTSHVYSNTESDGKDLLFTSDAGGNNPLAHEVVNWNTGGSTGEVWVKFPTLSSSTDTTFYVWYNNSSAIAPSADADNGSENVWDSNYIAVWHLNETVTDESSGAIHYDSTSNANNGSQSGNDDSASGKISVAQSFDGTNDYINIPDDNSLDVTSQITVSAWVYPRDTTSEFDQLISKKWTSDASPWSIFSLYRMANTQRYGFAVGFTDLTKIDAQSSSSISLNNWSYLTGTYDASIIEFFINGQQNGSTQSVSKTIQTNNIPARIGGNYYGREYANTIFDEVRISSIARSSGWTSTEYNNQNSPSTFISICGNGTIENNEQCDDSNTADGDGCSSACQISVSGYDSRHALTVDSGEVDENLSNFPILLADDNFLADVYSNTESDGKDLLFTSDITGATPLAHEVVNWNTGGSTSEVWVKIPSLSSSSDTTLYVWYNNSSAIAPGADADNGSENVWTEYAGVWHLNEDVNDEGTVADAHQDSRSSNLDGDQNGNVETADGITNAQNFDGNDCIQLPLDFVNGPSEFSAEGWFKSNSSTGSMMIWSIEGYYALYLNRDDTGELLALFDGSSSGDVGFGSGYNDNQWHHFVAQNNGTTTSIYVDGSFVNSKSETLSNPAGSSRNSAFGSQYECSTQYYAGLIDEMRFANSARSSGWISTSYNNQNSPSTFVTGSAVTASDLATTAGINNVGPVITATVSDGGSSSSAQTAQGSDVTFTVTAKDVNSDQYYLAICKTDAVTPGDNAAPTCGGGAWTISTATNSDAQASIAYSTIPGSEVEVNPWYGFVCDKVSGGGLCFPASASGDQGLAVGTITLTDIPADATAVTVDGVTYEFDTNSTFTNTQVDISGAQTRANAATALFGEEAGASSHMVVRANVVYVYADTKGTTGNSIAMAEVSDTGNAITLSGATLAGGSDDNASPFEVAQNPVINSVSIGDTSGGGGLNPATGTIEPGETVYFNANVTNGTVDMYVCDSAGFTYGASPSCTGTEICNVTGVDSSTDYPECSSATVASVPTAHGTYNAYVYIQDTVYNEDTGNNSHTYDVEDVAPTVQSYTATDAPAPAAGGSDTVDFSAVILDGNGDNDITAVEGVFFDDDAVNNDCTSAEANCYIDATCTLSDVSTPGSGKTATGTDDQLTALCSVTVWFNANASSNWEVHVKPTDGLGQKTGLADSAVNLTNLALAGINITQASIGYGSVALANVSTRQVTTMENMGNLVLDLFVEGDSMCTDYPGCAGSTISYAQQKFYHTDVDFLWNAATTAPGPYTLVDTASGTDDETGCLNRDIAVRTIHDNTSTNESIWWKLQIPATQALGTYTGQNSFNAASSDTCADAQSY